ncbi:hypothetical protein JXO52_17170 [bacterium]|nr:hypothetical protein [bacterium]
MVDINLFKDEEEDDLEPKPNQDINLPLDDVDDFLSDSSVPDTDFSDSDLLGPGDASARGTSDSDLSDLDLGGDDLGGKLDFEEDLSDFDDRSFGRRDSAKGRVDDAFLDEEFGDLPEEDGVGDTSDYAFGDVQKKRTPAWIWILFLVVVGSVCVYLFVLQPRMVQYKTVSVRQPGVTMTDSSAIAQADSARRAQDSLSTRITQPATNNAAAAAAGAGNRTALSPADIGSRSVYASAALRILEDLSKTAQFGAVLISGPQFAAVQYVSETPNVSQAMGHKIGTLLQLTSVKKSPEERHRTGGKLYYYGVVSGTLPGGGAGERSTGQVQSYADFTRDVKNSIRQHGLTLTDIQKLNEKQVQGHVQTDIRIKVSGSKAAVTAFLPTIGSMKDNIYITKLFMTPSVYTDFQAEQVKLVLEFRLVS